MPNTSLLEASTRAFGAIMMPLLVSLVYYSHPVGTTDAPENCLIQQSTLRSTADQKFMILGQSDSSAYIINTMRHMIRIHSYY
jgi:hypothetical protein